MNEAIERGYFGGTFFEFALQDKKSDAVIILPKFPSRNNYDSLITFFFSKGYHVFVPRYRGSFQSSGVFLSKNPVDEVIAFAKKLDDGSAKELWDMKKRDFKINKKILVGSGFGGAIALAAAAKSHAFSHLILAAPIWDLEKHNESGKEQDLTDTMWFVKRAFKNCYRFGVGFYDIKKKLGKFKELNPAYYLPEIVDMPILVFHDPNDKVVAFSRTKEFLGHLNRATYLEHYFGHKLNDVILAAYWKEIDKFIKVNYV